MSVAKVSEITATSTKSFEDAIKQGIARANKTLENILTFNPGWNEENESIEQFTDIRQLRDALVAAGIEISDDTTQGESKGPASFFLTDPDGNAILVDQHV